MLVVFGPSDDTHRHDSVIDITKWAHEYFQKPLSVSTIWPSADAKQTLSCKKEAICEHGPEAPSCPVGQGLFKIDCFKVEKCSMSDESKFDILFGNHGCHVLRAKEEEDLPVLSAFSSKASLSDGIGVHKCIRYGQLACFGRHYEC